MKSKRPSVTNSLKNSSGLSQKSALADGPAFSKNGGGEDKVESSLYLSS